MPNDTAFARIRRALLIAALVLVAYLPALRAGYVWDDDYHVTRNEALRTPGGLFRIWTDTAATPQYYPLTHTSFWIDYRLFGLDPRGYHAVNVLLHALVALLFWRLLLLLEVPGAWLAAALFAVHPVHVESVAWISERKNVLAGAFYLGAAICFLRRSRASAIVLFACALLSKSVTATLPVALALVVWWKWRRIERREIGLLGPMLLAGASMGWLTAWLEKHQIGASGEDWGLSLPDRFVVAGRAIWFYLGKLVWPSELSFVYSRWQIVASDPTGWAYLVAALGVGATLWFWRERIGRATFVAWAFFIVTLSPALGFFDVYPMRYSFVADHFQYLASLGPIALLAAAASSAVQHLRLHVDPPKKYLGPAAAAALILILMGQTIERTRVFRDEETLWRDTLAKNPEAWMARNNLGIFLSSMGRSEEAEVSFREALKLRPDLASAHNNLGFLLLGQNRLDEAAAHLSLAIELTPNDLNARLHLGEVRSRQGKLDEAQAQYAEAARLRPDSATARFKLATVLARRGKLTEALEEYTAVTRLDPQDAEARYNLGTLLAQQGRLREGIAELREALRLRPDFEEARSNLALALELASRRRPVEPPLEP